ncbi:MAG: TIGR03546 family protein [Spirochaetaceae bacterium]|jgi:uncharacterized protein (TIGR03546 family)|nr:TIGR03546 family protein [Spirochaetaceae bacterium]
MIKGIAQLILALNSNEKKTAVAAGFSWGVLLALLPSGNVFWAVLFFVSLFFKHNQGAKLLVTVLLKLAMPFLYPYTDQIGWAVLHIEPLQPFFTMLYNMPFVPFTRFNNTLVAGGLTAGVILWIPVFMLAVVLIPLYRNSFLPKITNSKVVKAIKNLPLVSKIGNAVAALKNMRDTNLGAM